MQFNKLVRDNIPEIIKKDGREPITRIAKGKEYEEALRDKLYEEVLEFLEEPSIEEVADILEVLHAICILKGVDLELLEEVRKKKTIERGGFEKGIILDRIE